jgi:RHS repeat-associated protein
MNCRKKVSDDLSVRTYAYDATGQLIAAGGQDYHYDANGNPDSSGDSLGPDNELLSDGTWNYTYDGAGNLIQKVSSGGSTTWTYGYNDANQMISAAEVSGGVTVLSIAYTYDVFGNRVAEMAMQGTTTTTEYVYDASKTLYADANSSGTIQTWYIAGVQGPDTWLARVDNTGSGQSAWLLGDHQGSVTAVQAMLSGAFTQISYDAFGNTTNVSYYDVTGAPTTVTLAPAQGRLGFQGGQWDSVVLVYRFGERDYNPLTQRWLTEDPTGLAAGPNPFEFANNDPTNETDPTGLRPDVQVTTAGLWLGDCGNFVWAVNFTLNSPASADGGWIVQEIDATRTVTDARGNTISQAEDAKADYQPNVYHAHYLEAWRVPPGKERPILPPGAGTLQKEDIKKIRARVSGFPATLPEGDDFFWNLTPIPPDAGNRFGGSGTKGTEKITGLVCYVDGDEKRLPRDKTVPRAPEAGTLPNLNLLGKLHKPTAANRFKWTQDPDRSILNYFDGHGLGEPAEHNLEVTWDCTAKASPTKIVSRTPKDLPR